MVLPCIWDNGFDRNFDPEKEHPIVLQLQIRKG